MRLTIEAELKIDGGDVYLNGQDIKRLFDLLPDAKTVRVTVEPILHPNASLQKGRSDDGYPAPERSPSCDCRGIVGDVGPCDGACAKWAFRRDRIKWAKRS